MERSELQEFKLLYSNTLMVVEFNKSLNDAKEAITRAFTHSQSRSKLVCSADKLRAAKHIDVKDTELKERNINIFGLSFIGVKKSVIAKQFNITTGRVDQIINSELAKFKHPMFQQAIFLNKILDRYTKLINAEIQALPSNGTACEMQQVIAKYTNLINHIEKVKKLSADGII